MRVAVFSDVHGNLVALEAVLAHIGGQRVDHVVCGGDLAFGGPDPEGSVYRVRTLGIPCVRGNTDEWMTPDVREHEPTTAWTRARLSAASREYLAGLPFLHRIGDLVVVHATPWSISDVVPKDADATHVRRMLDEAGARTVVYGHIHVAWIGHAQDGDLLVNAGSVGFPFDGDPRASYVVLERAGPGWSALIHRVAYDVERAAVFPADHPAPAAWASRMRTGRRG
ncbi:MAG: metallophosphoesterase family protein [Armatimonadota bacterium]|nr:metallophosphoesterase family protein [Armatimonadota bacterium]